MPLAYKIVGAQRLSVLEELVNIALEDGWVPQGGLVVGNDMLTHYHVDRANIDRIGEIHEQQVTRRTWYQALVRDEEPDTGAE